MEKNMQRKNGKGTEKGKDYRRREKAFRKGVKGQKSSIAVRGWGWGFGTLICN